MQGTTTDTARERGVSFEVRRNSDRMEEGSLLDESKREKKKERMEVGVQKGKAGRFLS